MPIPPYFSSKSAPTPLKARENKDAVKFSLVGEPTVDIISIRSKSASVVLSTLSLSFTYASAIAANILGKLGMPPLSSGGK